MTIGSLVSVLLNADDERWIELNPVNELCQLHTTFSPISS